MKKELHLKPYRFKLLFTLFMAITISFSAFSQRAVKGKVTDSENIPIPGANVYIKGTTNGTVTDIDGAFNLDVLMADSVMVISSVGYETAEISMGNQTNFEIALAEKFTELDQVVVIGYGTIKKSDLTGAVTTVKPEDLTQLSTYNVQQAMQGRVAGVMVTSNTGAPGAGMNVRIRGISTVNNADPLYVVDGFPVGGIDYINPSDIESMEVLKDASATAIYGNRGANGVILITTKRGKEQKTKVTLDISTGIQKFTNKIPVLDAAGYAEAKLLAYQNKSIIDEKEVKSVYDTTFDYVFANGFAGTNWQDNIFQTGAVKNYSLAVNGGSEKYKYSISGSYNNEDGVIINSWMKRFLLRFSNQFEISDRIKVDASISYVNRLQTNYDQDLYGQGILPPALYADPITPVFLPGTTTYAGVDYSGTTNPVAGAERMKQNRTSSDQLVLNFGLDYKIIEGLTFSSKFGFNVGFNRPKRYIPEYAIGIKDLNPTSSLDLTFQRTLSWSNSNYVNYNKEINKHSFNLMAGQESQYFDNFRTRLIVYDVPNDLSLLYATASPMTAAPSINSGIGNQNRFEWIATIASYFGRINYSYDGKYLLTANFRRDASSKIAKDYRWGNFPSVSAGWNIKNESFLKDVNLINALKLRVGWGKTGNEGSIIDMYALFASVTPALYTMGPNGTRVEGAMQTRTPNNKLQWEEVKQWNYAVDFALLNNKLNGTVDYFSKNTIGMIVPVPPPAFTGMNASEGNIGEMSNSGVEISLSFRNFDRQFKYEVGGNITFLEHPFVDKLAEEDQQILFGTAAKAINICRTTAGEEMAHFYGFETDGLLTQDDIDNTFVIDGTGNRVYTYAGSAFFPGQLKIVDQNNDGSITSADKVNIGSAHPDFIYGMNMNFIYKGFDLKLFIQGVQGNEMVNTLNVWLKCPDEGEQNLHEEVLESWTEDPANPGFAINPGTTVPRLVQGNKIFQQYFNDYLVDDGSYIRLKNVQLGYTIPNALIEKYGISDCRLYVSGENLFTITKYTGLDPEVGNFQFDNATQRPNSLSQGLDDAIYPIAKRFLFGLSVNF